MTKRFVFLYEEILIKIMSNIVQVKVFPILHTVLVDIEFFGRETMDWNTLLFIEKIVFGNLRKNIQPSSALLSKLDVQCNIAKSKKLWPII